MMSDEPINANMSEKDSASLCTLCVLETSVNVFENFSSSLSLDTQTPSSFNNKGINLATLQQSQLNVVEENMKVENDWRKFDSTIIENTEQSMMMNDKKIFKWTENQLGKNDDPESTANNCPQKENNATAISKYCENFFKCFQKTHKNDPSFFNESSSQKNGQNRTEQSQEQSMVFSLSSMSQMLSMEIGIVPKISQTFIDKIINDMDDDSIQSPKNISGLHSIDKLVNEQQQVSILKTSTQTASDVTNTENVVSTTNSLLEPKKNFQSRVTNGENHLKKVQFSYEYDVRNISPTETLKRNKHNDVIEEATATPKKKPKIISHEVLKIPLKHISLDHEHPVFGDSKEHINEKGDICNKNDQGNEICLSIDRSRKKIRKVEEETDVKGDSEKANTTRTGEALQDLSKLSPSSLKKSSPKRVSKLLMLQRSIDENSIRLLNQAKEMKKLSSFIDELRRNFGSKKTAETDVSLTKRKTVKKEFVSRCTQTADSHPIIIDVDDPTTPAIPSVLTVPATNVKSSDKNNDSRPNVEQETNKFRRNLFHSVVLKNDQNTVPTSITSKCHDTLKTLPSAPGRNDHQLSVNKTLPIKTAESQQKPNSLVQFDPYYNPLRPRRWPRNRNNQSVLRPSNQAKKTGSYFPPLPIVIRNVKSTNVTQ